MNTIGKILGFAAIVGAIAMRPGMVDAQSVAASSSEAIRPFTVHIPQKDIMDLRKRINETRWPEKEVVSDQAQGVQLATLQKVAHYWATDYDWRKLETRLNALPQFVTNIDGVDIYFIHVRSKHPKAMPLIMTHGWPGSIVECLGVIGPLTDPTAYGGTAEDAFDVVIPSLPGFGFSGKAIAPGWNSEHVARAWDILMKRLGYARYVAQGGDLGARVSAWMGHLELPGLAATHVNLLLSLPPAVVRSINAGDPPAADLPEDEKMAYLQRQRRSLGYYIEQSTRPQTIGYSLAETPMGLAAWIMDHDPHSYEQMARAFTGQPVGGLTRDAILDDITLYWLTNTGTSAARYYWEDNLLPGYVPVAIPAAFTVFPEETFQAPRSWVEQAFKNLIYFNKAGKGGHFAAWEQPQVMAEELRAAFRQVR